MSQVIETQEEREVREATEALAASKRKLALAEEARLAKAAADLAAHKAEQERQLHEAQLAREATEKKWAEEKQRKDAALKAEQAAQEAQKAALEAALAKEEEAKRQREAHAARLAKIEAERFQAEQDAARIQRELQQASSPKVESAPSTLATTPLSILFGGRTDSPTQPREISAVEHAQMQARQNAAPHVEASRKPCIPDGNDVVALEKLWYSTTQERPSWQKFEALLGKGYSVSEIEAALRAVQAQGTAMSSDGKLYAVESLLESQQ